MELTSEDRSRDDKFARLRATLERQRQRILMLEKENQQLREDNIFKASQINVLNIRLEAYGMMQRHESEKNRQVNDSEYTITTAGEDTGRRPFGFDQLVIEAPCSFPPPSGITSILQQNLTVVESHSNLSLNYTADKEARTPFGSEELLPRLTLVELSPTMEPSMNNSDQVNTSIAIAISNKAYIRAPVQTQLTPTKHFGLKFKQPSQNSPIKRPDELHR